MEGVKRPHWDTRVAQPVGFGLRAAPAPASLTTGYGVYNSDNGQLYAR